MNIRFEVNLVDESGSKPSKQIQLNIESQDVRKMLVVNNLK